MDRRLILLERAHAEAEDAVVAMRQRWASEDAATRRARLAELGRHEQGMRDRDAMRVALGGTSLLAPPPAHEPSPDPQATAAAALREHQKELAAVLREDQKAEAAKLSKTQDAEAAVKT